MTFFRGWSATSSVESKPLPREVDVKLTTLDPVANFRSLFRLTQVLNPPCPHIRRAHVESPFSKRGTLLLLRLTFSIGEFMGLQASLRPPFAKGGQGDFYCRILLCQSEHIYDNSYNANIGCET